MRLSFFDKGAGALGKVGLGKRLGKYAFAIGIIVFLSVEDASDHDFGFVRAVVGFRGDQTGKSAGVYADFLDQANPIVVYSES